MSECISCGYTNQIEELEKEIATLKAQLKREMDCVDFYAIEACDEDWCERYLPESDRGIIDYLSGKLARETVKSRTL